MSTRLPTLPTLPTLGLWPLISLAGASFLLIGGCDNNGESQNDSFAFESSKKIAAQPLSEAIQIAIGPTTQSVVALQVKELLATTIGKQFRTVWFEQALSDLVPFDGCDLNPEAVTSVVLGIGPNETVRVITTELARTKIQQCARWAAKRFGKTFEEQEDGKLMPLWQNDRDVSWVVFIDDNTFVTGSESEDPQWVSQLAQRTMDSNSAAKTLVSLINKTSPQATVRMAMASDKLALPNSLGNNMFVTEISGSIDATSGIRLHGTVSFNTEETARLLAEKGQALDATAGLGLIDVSVTGNQLHVKIEMTEKVLEERLKVLGPVIQAAIGREKGKSARRKSAPHLSKPRKQMAKTSYPLPPAIQKKLDDAAASIRAK